MHELHSQYPTAVAGRATNLEHEMVLYPFGVPLIVASNSAGIMDHLDAALGRWKSMPTSYREDVSPCRLEIIVAKDMAAELESQPRMLTWRGRGGMLMVSAPGLDGAAAEPSGVIFAAPEWVATGRAFADVVATPLAVFLTSESLPGDRVFLRASAFVRGDAALVLLADSETARLQLAGGLHRAGFEMLASDFLLAARHPARGLELWGHPSAIPPVLAADLPNDEQQPASPGWTPLPLEGGAKVHLQHVGPVLLAVLDDTAPGPESDNFPAQLPTDANAMQQTLTSKASLRYPPPVCNDAAPLSQESAAIVAELARSRVVRLPSADPEAMLPGLLLTLNTLGR